MANPIDRAGRILADIIAGGRRGTQVAPGGLVDAHGRSLPLDANGWPVGTESFATPYRGPLDAIDPGVPPAVVPDMELGSDLWHQMDKGARSYDNMIKGRTGNLRHQNPELNRIRADDMRTRNAEAAAAREAELAKYQGMREGAEELGAAAIPVAAGVIAARMAGDALDGTGGTEDLKAETNGAPPEVAAVEEEPEVMPVAAQPSGRELAAMLIRKLNEMRRAAGGEVPEAPAMMAEIERLLSESNERVNAPGARPARNDHGRAMALIGQLNALRSQAGGEVPQAPGLMAQAARLQAMGDAKRNAYQTGR